MRKIFLLFLLFPFIAYAGNITIVGGGGSSQWTGSNPVYMAAGTNVGIGSTAPGTVLDVQGTVRTTGFTLSSLSGTQCLHAISGVVSGTGSDCGSGGGSMTWPASSGIAVYSGSNSWSSSISGTAGQFVKGNGSLDSSTYLTGNQSISLGGILSGSGATSITASAAGGYYMPTTTDQSTWNGKQANLSLVAGTYVDGKYCTYTSSGTVLNCNSTPITSLSPITLSGTNVGIGSTAPNQTLDVNGTVRISSYVLFPSDGDQQYMGNTDVSKFHIGAYATGSGTLATLITGAEGGTSDFSHYYFNHNVATASNGNISATDDASSTSYSLSMSDNGYINVFQAPAAGTATFNSVPTWALNMITGNMGISTFAPTNAKLIVQGGNVGIGSVAPGQLLDVNGTARAIAHVTRGGTASQFVKGDGSLDSTSYQASGSYLTAVTADSPLSGSGTSASHLVISTAGTWSGNAGTATALASAPTTCSAGQGATGINASGTAQGCTTYLQTDLWTASGSNVYRSSGNAGISNSSPGETLDVSGTIRGTALIIGSGNTVVPTNGAYIVGNVGIGSTYPGQALDVQGTIRGTYFYGNGAGLTNLTGGSMVYPGSGIAKSTGSAWSSSISGTSAQFVKGDGSLDSNTYSTATVNSGTSGQAAYYSASSATISGTSNLIFSGSNVGIGSTTPGQILDVQGTVRSQYFTATGTSSSYFLTNVGIGNAAPGETLDVSGTIRATTLIAGSSLPLISSGVYMAGNVGINSVAPGAILDVQGTVRATGFTLSGASNGTIVCNSNGRLGHCTAAASCTSTCTCTCTYP